MNQDDDYMTVKLTIRRPVAERLRAICHRRGETASIVVGRWVLSADADGNIGAAERQRDWADEFLGGVFGGRR